MTAARTRVIPALLMALASALVAGCSSDATADTTTTSAGAGTQTEAVSGTVVVSAAASLTDVFAEIGDDFTAEHPDAEITFNVGSSGQLSTQIQQGAPADLAAFADTAPMDALAEADLLDGSPEIFARNTLVIVTKPGNPERITGLADLTDVGVVALCAETAPCGKFADRILDAAGVVIPTDEVTRGQDVRATLTAVTEGDAVAGIVYVTDAATVEDAADSVEIPDADNVIALYPIATVAESSSTALADAFRAFVLSDAGQGPLRDAGFLAP